MVTGVPVTSQAAHPVLNLGVKVLDTGPQLVGVTVTGRVTGDPPSSH